MTAKRRQRRPSGKQTARPAHKSVAIRPVEGHNAFELVHPRCAQQRAEDLEEVHAMLAAGEIDVAQDELRWLLEGCRAFIEAHKLLGEIAMADGDLPLARGHFGRAYELGLEALPPDRPRRLPYYRPANRAFLEAAKGLAWCLEQLSEKEAARQVIDRLLAFDPSDPLKVRNAGPAGDPGE